MWLALKEPGFLPRSRIGGPITPPMSCFLVSMYSRKRPAQRDIAVAEADYLVEVEVEIYSDRHPLSRRRSVPQPRSSATKMLDN
ncbi:MAG: hypothetical protein WAV18_23255 [Roseiarcus sp.]